jgi:hypothetical protein
LEVLSVKFEQELCRVRRLVLQGRTPGAHMDETVMTFPELLAKHDAFLDECLLESLLTHRQQVLLQHTYFQQCHRFRSQCVKFTKAVEGDLSLLTPANVVPSINDRPVSMSGGKRRGLVEMFREVLMSMSQHVKQWELVEKEVVWKQ